MTRTGKIARLPRHIRDEINRRIDDGEPGIRILEWLNAQEDVKAVLDTDFGGRPINEPNLSDWKNGGYLDWQRTQASRDWVMLMAEDADQLADDAGLMHLNDRIATLGSLALGNLIRELGPKAETDKEARSELFRTLRELARLRNDDMRASHMLLTHAINTNERRRERERKAASLETTGASTPARRSPAR